MFSTDLFSHPSTTTLLTHTLHGILLQDTLPSFSLGLQSLPHLQRLELGKNKITKIEGLESQQYLSQVSLEDNEIGTLGAATTHLC